MSGTALAALVAATTPSVGPGSGAAPALAATGLTSTTPTAVGDVRGSRHRYRLDDGDPDSVGCE